MFAKPPVSRGKARKALAADKQATPGQASAAAALPSAPSRETEDKRSLRRATKAQRRANNLRRSGDYEVEDVGRMYGQAHGVEVASDTEEGDSSSGPEGGADHGPGSPSPSAREAPRVWGRGSTASAAFGSKELAAAASTAAASAAGCGQREVDDEIQGIKAGIQSQLWQWAKDADMPEDEKRRSVRQLLAHWHPDKNRHIHAVATQIFQFIQTEVNQIISELKGSAASEAARKAAEAHQRKMQRLAEKSAKTSALKAAREEKLRRKCHAPREEGHRSAPQEGGPAVGAEATEATSREGEEWSVVVGHGPATTSFLRPWPRSHFSLTVSPVDARCCELLLFGGEAYDGRELTFYSDLYRLNLQAATAEPDVPLPWEKLYASVPLVPGPEARSSHQAVVWDRWLYVIGGEWSSRDQRRYRQFNDCWRFDVTARPGTRWECVRAEGGPGGPPCPRSGHRMAATHDGRALLFGGFTEDKQRRATYLNDLHMLDLRQEEKGTWCELGNGDGRSGRALSRRSGHVLWVAGGAVHVYGGARVRKGAQRLEVLEDLWRAPLGGLTSRRGAPCLGWEALAAQGQGPGRRTGLCQCAVSPERADRRLVFGGVTDVPLPRCSSSVQAGARAGPSAEISIFMNDLFALDCQVGQAPVWSRVWPLPGAGIPAQIPSLDPTVLPSELAAEGGGVDVLALLPAAGGKCPADKIDAPRGRIAAGCAVVGRSLWIFGGACEAGPRREVTLDDVWRLDLDLDERHNEVRCCGRGWECVLPLSERATVWFDSESDDDDDNGEDGGLDMAGGGTALAEVHGREGVLSKTQQKAAAKQARMEFKREKQREKCEEKLDKREAKKERQRQEARGKAAGS